MFLELKVLHAYVTKYIFVQNKHSGTLSVNAEIKYMRCFRLHCKQAIAIYY